MSYLDQLGVFTGSQVGIVNSPRLYMLSQISVENNSELKMPEKQGACSWEEACLLDILRRDSQFQTALQLLMYVYLEKKKGLKK